MSLRGAAREGRGATSESRLSWRARRPCHRSVATRRAAFVVKTRPIPTITNARPICPPGDPPAREPGEQHSSHSHRDQADDHEDDANPRLKTRTVKSPRSSLPLATAASRMASAPGSGSNPPATPSPSRMPSTRPGARHRLEVVRVVSTPRVAVQRRTPVGFTPGDRQEAPLASQHPETDADDQASGPDGEIRLDSLRDQPGGAKGRQDGDQHDPARVRQRDEQPEDEGVDRASAHADDVGRCDGLAVPGRRGVERSEPEARREVEESLSHASRSAAEIEQQRGVVARGRRARSRSPPPVVADASETGLQLVVHEGLIDPEAVPPVR